MKKIIIAERIMEALSSQESIFRRGNLEIVSARSCEDILAMQQRLKADLLVTTLKQPIMGGLKLGITIRGDEKLRDVSLILVRDDADVSEEQCRESRANAIVQAPIDPIELFSTISELLVVPHRKDIRSLLHASVKGDTRGQSFLGVTSNISISGLLMETEVELAQGERLTFSLSIAGREVAGAAVVMRIAPASDGRTRYGVKFSNLDTKSMIIIDQFVKGSIRH
jgi:CheY-like chemotaxis protein